MRTSRTFCCESSVRTDSTSGPSHSSGPLPCSERRYAREEAQSLKNLPYALFHIFDIGFIFNDRFWKTVGGKDEMDLLPLFRGELNQSFMNLLSNRFKKERMQMPSLQ